MIHNLWQQEKSPASQSKFLFEQAIIIYVGAVYAYTSWKCSAVEKNIEEIAKSGIWIFRGVTVTLLILWENP